MEARAARQTRVKANEVRDVAREVARPERLSIVVGDLSAKGRADHAGP